MRIRHHGPAAKPKTVLAAQGVIWLQFTAIVVLYSIGVRFLFDATRSSSSHDSMLDVIGSIDLDAHVLPEVRAHGGALLVFNNAGLLAIRR